MIIKNMEAILNREIDTKTWENHENSIKKREKITKMVD